MESARGHRTAVLVGTGVLLGALFGASAAGAQGQALKPRLAGSALVAALEQGGHVILLRHASTDPIVPDPERFDIADCSTQRTLSERGRRQARAIGRAVEALGIPVGPVLSSPYCRCVETGMLAFGAVETSEVLSSGDELSGEEKDARGAKIREMLDTAPAPGLNTVLITHSGNLLYAFGLQVRPEGIAHVFRPTEFGPALYVGRLLPEEWPGLAGIAPESP